MGITIYYRKWAKIISLVLLPLSSVVLIALQWKLFGWSLLGLGIIILLFSPKQFRRDILLIYISLLLLGITPINTDIRPAHFFLMAFFLSLAILIPYGISRFINKNHLIKYRFHHGRSWTKTEIGYIFFTAFVCYLVFPFMLRETGSYLHWTVLPGVANLTVLFIGTNALGIWDELFFINTVFAILRNYLSFWTANLLQAVMFTSFLYELGFRGWAFLVIFMFALLQGYVFKKTDSLLYIITIHLTADLILYLTLIYLHHPNWLHFFIT